MKRTIVAAAVLLAACHNGPARPEPPPFIGNPLDQVVKQMGYPQGEREFEGDKVYTWSSSYLKTKWIFIRARETCTMSVGVKDGLVKRIDYNGDSGPCDALQGQLNDR